ncbi:hypothetical protein RS030_192766 [Cryptosporidium xiaoi]|uniref:Uncharacterized protein n=1 Tax=Cryptosporidium xiaoi TaxID=659607 RepID=A0AAV9Y4F6_9CRYT
MILREFKSSKLLKSSDKIETLTEYLFKLKESDLNSSSPLSPDVEDLFRIHLANLSFGETQSLLEKFVFPGIKILSNNPNALIGDAISIVISLAPFKNCLFINENVIERFSELFIFKDWEKLSQRAICIRISILITLIESKILFNRLIPYLKDFIFLIFNNFEKKSYFIYKSVSNLLSVIVDMEILNSFVFENFHSFQNNLYICISNNSCDVNFSLIQMYKLLINNKNLRMLLFKWSRINNNEMDLCDSCEKIKHYNTLRHDSFDFLLNKLLPLILNNTDNFVSNIGLEILDIILSDTEIFDSNLLLNLKRGHKKRISNLMKSFSKTVINNKGAIKSFILELNILNIIIDNNESCYIFLDDLAYDLLRFTRMLVSSHACYTSCKQLIHSGLFKTLLRVISNFGPLSQFKDNGTKLHYDNFDDSDLKLNYDAKRTNMFICELLETVKVILINLDGFKKSFHITESEILNYTTLMLKSALYCIFRYSASYEHLILFIEEVINIYNRTCLSTWELCFIVKYLITIFSDNNTFWLSDKICNKIVIIIENSIFDHLIINGKSGIQIKNYVITGPNIVLLCSELLVKLTNMENLDGYLYEALLALSSKFIKECLKYKPSKSSNAKANIFHDHYEFFINFMSQFNVKSNNTIVFDSFFINYIIDFSRNGLSPSLLNAVFQLLEIIIRQNNVDVEIELVENLVTELLNYYVPFEENNSYLTLFNTYKYICDSSGKMVNLPNPSQINDDSIPKFNDFDTNHLLNDSQYIKDIVNRFLECTIDCIGD